MGVSIRAYVPLAGSIGGKRAPSDRQGMGCSRCCLRGILSSTGCKCLFGCIPRRSRGSDAHPLSRTWTDTSQEIAARRRV